MFTSRLSCHGRSKLASAVHPKSTRSEPMGERAEGSLTNGRTPSEGHGLPSGESKNRYLTARVISPRPTFESASFSHTTGLMSSRASSRLVIPVLRSTSTRNCCSVWPWLTRDREYSTPLSICRAAGGTVIVLVETLGRSVGIRSSWASATDGPKARVAQSAMKPKPRGLIGSSAGVAPSEFLPERRLLPARLRQTPPALVEVRVREQDRDHLLAAPVPEPEPPGRRRARVAIAPEEGGAGHATDPRQLRAGRAAVIVDAQMEVPDPGVDRQVPVERRHRGARGEPDLVGSALDQRSDGELVPVLREELGEQALDPIARDGHFAVLGGDAVQPALARRHTPSEGHATADRRRSAASPSAAAASGRRGTAGARDSVPPRPRPRRAPSASTSRRPRPS